LTRTSSGDVADVAHKFLPDGLSPGSPTTPSADEKRFVSQIQGRTTPISLGWSSVAKVLELSQDHWFGDQAALEALVGSATGAEHQALFRRIDAMAGSASRAIALRRPQRRRHAVLGKSTWAVLR
jgi:hypothetical protein